MKSKKSLAIVTILLLSIFISACSSAIYASTGWHGLTANTDTAYVAVGTQVYAVDLNTHNEKWRYPEKANNRITFYANPVLTADGQLLVPSYDHILYVVDAATGKELWSFKGATNRLIGSPLVIGNIAYQPSADGFIYAIDMTSHQQVWKQETGGPIWAQPADNGNCNCIFVASMDHFLYSFDAAAGSLKWKTDLGGAIVGTPAVSSDGSLYVGTFNKQMIALDASTGAIRWRFDTQDWVWSGPALDNNVLYFGDLAGNIYAVNAADGTKAWSNTEKSPIVDTPIVSQGKIYFTTESDTLYILDLAGNTVNSKVIGGVIYSSPAISGNTLLVAPTNFDATLVALNLDGVGQWSFTPGK